MNTKRGIEDLKDQLLDIQIAKLKLMLQRHGLWPPPEKSPPRRATTGPSQTRESIAASVARMKADEIRVTGQYKSPHLSTERARRL
ncbi:MAG: hypothetical protein FJW35_14140 [Acidobacteria bacterium]|nr:hypothetical protein [Acidobacteriota bacterium]